MDSPTPPTPQSMSDDELNAEVARLQSQPDGLMAAMALIESQNVLRQQDSFNLSQWQLQAQMQAASAPLEPTTPQPVVPEPVVPEPAVPEPVVPEPITPEPVAKESESYRMETSEQNAAPVVPSPITTPATISPLVPTQTAEEENSVDDIVAVLNRNYASAATEEPATLEDAPTATPTEAEQVVLAESSESEPSPISIVPTAVKESPSSVEPVSVEEETNTVSISRTKTSAAFTWSWISLASTPLIIVMAAFLRESAASFAQALVVISGLVVTASVLAGIGAVAAKRGSNPIGVVSRAAFGVWGNLLPGTLMLFVKIVWSIALVIFGARMLSPLVSSQPWFSALSMQFVFPAEFTAMLLTAVPMVLVGSLVSGFGGITMLRSQQLTAIFSLIGVVAIAYFIFSSNSILDLQQGQLLGAPALLDLAILCFAFFGFTVFSQSGDFARKLSIETPGAKVFFLSFVSTLFIPAAVGVLSVLWIYMAEESFVVLLTDQLLPTVSASAPLWIFITFVVAVGLSLLQLLASAIYSLSGSLASTGAKIPGAISSVLFAIILLAGSLAAGLTFGTSSLLSLLVDVLLLVSVVAASYTGIVLADALIRSRDYHEVSLARDYGFYGRFNVANTLGFLVATALGFGYLKGQGLLSFWAGYLGDLTPGIFDVVGSNIGIAMAFGLAVLFPVAFGIPRVKGQERKLVELDERREELKEYLDTAK